MNMHKWSFISIFFIALFLRSQELPPIKNFSPLEYKGENQNWGISEGGNGYIYVANNHSLLEYDGVVWNKYESPNASIFRSVAAKGALVYTGQYMEFGYWQKNVLGKLEYSSISDLLEVPMLEDEEFWNIVILEDWVLFQSLDRIYSYNIQTAKFNILEAKSAKAHIFIVDGTVYFQKQDIGVYKIGNNGPQLVMDHNTLGGRSVVGMFREDNETIVVLDNAKFFRLTGTSLTQWVLPASRRLEGLSLYCTERLRDGSYVLGSISNGIYQIDPQGKFLRAIDQRKGLHNNTILHVFQDSNENLWLGLDNGISVVNINSPFNEYTDNLGVLGLVYASIVFKGKLYLGSNQGLFVKPRNSEGNFKMVPGTDGQVWSLTTIDGTLFCGHNKGTFEVVENKAKLISALPGTWTIKEVKGNKDILLQGNYDGLSILVRKDGVNWELGHRIKGFDISSRFFEQIGTKEILVNHEYKGLYQLTLDKEWKNVTNEVTHPIMGYGSSIVNYQNKIYYTSLEGAFVKKEDSLFFSADTTLIGLLFERAGGVTSSMIPDSGENRVWCFTHGGLSYLYPKSFNSSISSKTISIPSFIRGSLGVSGFENLTRMSDEKYLIGMSNGFVALDLRKLKRKSHKIAITKATNQVALEAPELMPLLNGQELDYRQNTLSFSYAVPQFDKYSDVSYKYRLVGLFDKWSPLDQQPNVTFSNLKPGDYRFEVMAKVGGTLTENTAKYNFLVKRPWYFTNMAIALYVLLLGGVFLMIHKLYRSYYTKKQDRILDLERKKQKRKKLKAEKELIQLRNEKLRAEVESKNRELAVATMSMIKKNEFLNAIKSRLIKVKDNTEVKSVIRTIDRNINNEDDWQFFKEAFNNADKGFMKKIKEAHPKLTPNDLKLCAYLRLNLSSKEIAPLLNISLRSVEVKRYRLRKKMALLHEKGLTDYIMSL